MFNERYKILNVELRVLGIIILNYNNWKLTVECIKSIQKTTCCNYKIYVVDNLSQEKASKAELLFLNSCNNVKLIYNQCNKGYSAGNNVGIDCALKEGCQDLLITNNDVIFSDGCIDGLKSYLEENANVAIVGPKVYLPSGELQEINMGCKMTLKGKYLYLLRKTPLKFCAKAFVEKFHAEDKDINKPFEVFGVSGCCFMISSRYTNVLCPFDEGTFLYEEENIISHKVEQINKKVIYDSDVSIIHLGGASTKGMSAFAYTCQVESEIYYCAQYLDSNFLALKLFVFLRTLMYLKYYGVGSLADYIKKIRKMYRKINFESKIL